jgi:hypothetical protein
MFTVLGMVGASTTVSAYNTDIPKKAIENSLLKTTAGCKNATAAIDMDINNVRARLMTGGDMWYNIGTGQPAYEVPKNGQKHSLFAGSCWIGGIDGNGQLKVSAQLFRTRGNDYWPGPIDRVTKNITETTCSEWDRFWKVNASTIQDFRQLYADGGASAVVEDRFDVIKQWPATGNIYAVGANNNSLPELLGPVDQYGYAPFVDVNGDGKYSWTDGDYPASYGARGSNPSQFVWWIFNDIGNTKTMTKTQSIGMEVQTSAFAYSSTDFLNDATFYNYRLINRGNIVLDSCFIATWTDADLGSPFDDYIGCDTNRGLGILYNAETPDRPNGQNTYGSRLPMIGVDFFIGPNKRFQRPDGTFFDSLLKMRSFSYFTGSFTGPVRDPRTGTEFYNYMTGSNADGVPFSNDQSRGAGSVGYGIGPIAPFVFYGDPGNPSEWSMCAAKVPPADQRFIHSAGPFILQPGAKNDITIGVVWVDDVGGCGRGSFKKIRAADDIAQALFDNGFRRTVGPEAPVLTIRELDKKLVFYITNPKNSNNFNEQYGDPKYISNDIFRIASAKAKAAGAKDSLYRFEGYQVFQLRGPSVSLFDENGNLTKDAALVFETDRRNGIGQIVNYTKNLDVKSTIDQYNASIKVEGKDSGIVHSFMLTEDAFATGNRQLVNYKTYYYVAIAYAHNNFLEFDPANEVGTQDKAYLIGDNGPGAKAIARYPAMPNSMNQTGDTFANAEYGQGVVITRIEGIGNGGSDVQLNDTSETAILSAANGQIAQPTYVAGKGPVKIKVVDPIRLVNSNWRISLLYNGSKSDSTNLGMVDSTKWRIDRLDDNGAVIDTIYSERDISVANEQILEKYGLSVSVNQTYVPGARNNSGLDSADVETINGYITSDVKFDNSANPWLSGVTDGSTRSLQNWIRSGTFVDEYPTGTPFPDCGPFDDYIDADRGNRYGLMFNNNSNVVSTWAPYDLSATVDGNTCGFAPAVPGSVSTTNSLYVAPGGTSSVRQSEYPNVDLVFTSDKTKWTRCVVLETQNSTILSEGNVAKFKPRSHQSWNMGIDDDGNPVYSAVKGDTGFSYFPGYAINQLTGERLNIAFGEDSYLKKFNGADMLWNPTSDLNNQFGETVFGGRHFTYVLNTKYDSCKAFTSRSRGINDPSLFGFVPAYRQIRWVGNPTLSFGARLLSLKDGIIPTTTRLRFRVNTPYKAYKLMDGQVAKNGQFPMYNFSTKGMATSGYSDKVTADKLMDKIFAVPNPYKGQAYGGNTYESNRLETKIKIINLPVKATINIYSLDGTLVRRLEKANNENYVAWDLYNQAGLPIASGMYLIHVNAYGKDKVIRWFGAMRPIDITNN